VIPPSHLLVLHKICKQLDNTSINWAVVGSLGLALQGVPVEVHDIDLSTDAAGVYEIERLFSAFITRPVEFSAKGNLRSHFGALELDGIQVEIMGNVQARAKDGTWSPPTDLHQHKLYIEVEGMQVPVLSLEHEYQAYVKLGRFEKAKTIKKHLSPSEQDLTNMI
jgi:hypothetical protein